MIRVNRLECCCWLFVLFLVCLSPVQGNRQQNSPCPSILRYEKHQGYWYAIIRRDSLPYGTEMILRVGVSVNMQLPQNVRGQIELLGGEDQARWRVVQGLQTIYKIGIPIENVLPKITHIAFENQLVCRGQPEFGEQTTDYALRHKFNAATNDAASNAPNRFAGDDSGSEIIIFNDDNTETNNNYYNPRPQWGHPHRQPQPQPQQPSPESQPALLTNEETCGLIGDNNPLYIQGENTNKGDWPWLVAIYVEKPSSLEFRCAGTLITKKHVITAAHCTTDQYNKEVLPESMDIKVGVFNLQDWTDEDVKQMAVWKIVKHPKYSGRSSHLDDIAVIIFAKAVEFGQFIRPACIWSGSIDQEKIVGLQGTVVGWGRDEYGLVATPEPRKGRVPIVSTATCRASLQLFEKLTSDSTICAGARDGTGPCNGDSGGGLYLEINGHWYLRGIVSISIPGTENPCNLNEYIVYTDTAKYLPWINAIIAESS